MFVSLFLLHSSTLAILHWQRDFCWKNLSLPVICAHWPIVIEKKNSSNEIDLVQVKMAASSFISNHPFPLILLSGFLWPPPMKGDCKELLSMMLSNSAGNAA
jgi:hypothetical protein